MEQKFCQSCGMPMYGEVFGTEKDGAVNKDYCKYCYESGEFTFHGSMDEMIAICIPHMVEGNPDMTEEKAKTMMQQFFPTLKRWKQ